MHRLLFGWVPRRTLTRLAGWAASRAWPRPLLTAAIRLYVRAYGIDLSQFEGSPGSFSTFNAFFVRPLRPGVRPVDPAPEAIVSPVDGTVSAAGEIADGRLFQAKGLDYSLEALLGGEPGWEAYTGGAFATLYLSPRDYHRFHSPVAGEAVRWRHVPGDLWTVSPGGVRGVPDLFVRNERVVTRLRTAGGEMAFVAVGALIVGAIRLVYHRGSGHSEPGACPPGGAGTLEPPWPLEKGAELGRFQLGSTVILLFRPGEATLHDLRPGETLCLGERIGTLHAPSGA